MIGAREVQREDREGGEILICFFLPPFSGELEIEDLSWGGKFRRVGRLEAEIWRQKRRCRLGGCGKANPRLYLEAGSIPHFCVFGCGKVQMLVLVVEVIMWEAGTASMWDGFVVMGGRVWDNVGSEAGAGGWNLQG